MDETSKVMVMKGLRPNTSDNEPTNNILMASAMVVHDNVKLDTAGDK
jgi:hypothetical protein